MSINRLLVPLASVWLDPHVMHWSSSSPLLLSSPLPSVSHLPVVAAGSMPHRLPAAAAGSAAPCRPPSSARPGRTPPAFEFRAPRPPDSSRCRPNQFAAARFVAPPSSVRGLGPPASPSFAHASWLRPRLRALSTPVVPPLAPLQAPPHQSSVSHRRSSSLPERRLRALRAPVAPPPAPLQAPPCRSSDPHRRSSSLPERRLRLLTPAERHLHLLHACRAPPSPAVVPPCSSSSRGAENRGRRREHERREETTWNGSELVRSILPNEFIPNLVRIFAPKNCSAPTLVKQTRDGMAPFHAAPEPNAP
ncbi:hypothetical protein PVAP13_5KG742550 [Panicum virgatum]|uniref:Uncharacterized protein n=1 Tax=Panicum virgatum TaxID=38727 RepID=A0A8T0SY68_PANVG|nr:hypothetical protein PVAP13_5KG742550 [Panicum virgatum]